MAGWRKTIHYARGWKDVHARRHRPPVLLLFACGGKSRIPSRRLLNRLLVGELQGTRGGVVAKSRRCATSLEDDDDDGCFRGTAGTWRKR